MGLLDTVGDIFGLNSGGTAPSLSGDMDIDQQTKNATQNKLNYANRTNDQFAQDSLSGTNNQAAVKTPDQIQQKQTELGGPTNSALSGAISAKQQNMYSKGQAKLQAQAALNAPQQKEQAMQQAESALYAEDQVAYQHAKMKMQDELNKTAIRNGVLTSLLGGAGSAGSSFVGNSQAGKE